ncbi:MAG: flagellar protein FlaG [Pseudomonadales bacterium]
MNELNSQDIATRKIALADSVQPAATDVKRQESVEQKPQDSGKILPREAANSAAPDPKPQLDEAVVELNDYVQSLQRDLRFTVDAELGRPVVSVVDSNTEQVIRKIPSDVVLRLARNLKESAETQQTEALNDSLPGSNAASGYDVGASADALNLIKTKA